MSEGKKSGDQSDQIAALRKEYTQGAGLDCASVSPNPFEQFRLWFEGASAAGVEEANAMALATVGADGAPSVRMVLLKDFSERGFIFYTNYASQKGRELGANSRAALAFYWSDLERQIRIEGTVTKVASEISDRYFASRPRGSQIGAACSAQSSVIEGRAVLEKNAAELDARFAGKPIPRPAGWGGYELSPTRFEFWQGRENRLHDWVEYVLSGNSWKIRRLAP